jgi:hypothetical protein
MSSREQQEGDGLGLFGFLVIVGAIAYLARDRSDARSAERPRSPSTPVRQDAGRRRGPLNVNEYGEIV